MYTSCILQALYNTLKEAYIDVTFLKTKNFDKFFTFQFILSRGRDEFEDEEEDFNCDGRRISVWSKQNKIFIW